MRKMLVFLLLLVAMCLSACQREEMTFSSDIYNDKELNQAVRVIEKQFAATWTDCQLTNIRYDAKLEASFGEWADQAGYDEGLVLVSDIQVEDDYEEGNLEPGTVLKNWQWILVRKEGGKWHYYTSGYAG